MLQLCWMCTKTVFLFSTPEAVPPAGSKLAVGTACDILAKPLASFQHRRLVTPRACFLPLQIPPPSPRRVRRPSFSVFRNLNAAHSLGLPFTQPQRGRDPVELLCAGCYVELQDGVDPALAWAAEVEENVGGRLKLRLLGTQGLPDTPATLWLFYLHPRLHPPGWAKEHGCTLRPPAGQCCCCRVSALYLETKEGGQRRNTKLSGKAGIADLIEGDGKYLLRTELTSGQFTDQFHLHPTRLRFDPQTLTQHHLLACTLKETNSNDASQQTLKLTSIQDETDRFLSAIQCCSFEWTKFVNMRDKRNTQGHFQPSLPPTIEVLLPQQQKPFVMYQRTPLFCGFLSSCGPGNYGR